jgi:hypothetical protein
VVVGGALGLGSALAVSRMLQFLLFQVKAYDPLTFAVVFMLLEVVAAFAILISARNGMRVQPDRQFAG